ncbi:enoyl-CoA hydratase/isomerase family protein [Pseudonocardia kujensis]|uniref:enoyl-CoA hydratase/isomerase family protein n=1 Tax=Pseudonocardia kujensis TaxID=1128675 RepID=UPI001E657FF8|nr:enoyl-CoA hydratase/isomerase family protein [Pseudonocardia kujensis]MCE0768477.1 enoyl-CoA hydratase/isomerase family protein [Pseudonocardia kujensis]
MSSAEISTGPTTKPTKSTAGVPAPGTRPDGAAVLVERRGRVGVVTIDRPAKYNAINYAVVDGLQDAITGLGDDPAIGAIVLTGAGKAFAAGADIALYSGADADEFARFTERCNALCDTLAASQVPVVAAVNGLALGGGFELVLSCDVVIAATDATFGLPEVALGLLPGWGGTQRLTWHVGPNRAKWLIMSGRRIDAHTAEQLGIVTQTCRRDELDQVATGLADDLAGQAPCAIAAIREAVTAAVPYAAAGSEGPGFRLERDRLTALFTSPDGQEGIAAFVQKRPARFRARTATSTADQ